MMNINFFITFIHKLRNFIDLFIRLLIGIVYINLTEIGLVIVFMIGVFGNKIDKFLLPLKFIVGIWNIKFVVYFKNLSFELSVVGKLLCMNW